MSLDGLDITEYPQKLYSLAEAVSKLKKEKEELELTQKRIACPIIAEVDSKTYKNAAIRDNFVTFALEQSADYVKIEDRIVEITAKLRSLNDEEALTRRCFRILEQEYMAHGTRTYATASLAKRN